MHPMRCLACLLALAIPLLIMQPVAVAESDVLRAPISPYAPWRIVSPNGEVSGIDVDVIKEICSRMGLTLKTEEVPFARALVMLEQGDCDIGTSLQRRPDREIYMHYLEPPYITGSDKVFYILRRSGCQINSYEDLESLRIGVIAGTKYFPRFDSDTSLNKIAARDADHLFELLLNQRIDTFVYASSVGDYLMKVGGHTKDVVQAPYRHSKQIKGYLTLSKRSPLAFRLEEFNYHLQRMLNEGVVQQIMNKYWLP